MRKPFFLLLWILIFYNFTIKPLSASNMCEMWFEESNIKPGTDSCELECSALRTGMNTFTCTKECKKLCTTAIPRRKLDKYVYFNTLTLSEKNLVSKYPVEALIVYMAKEEAIESTKINFGINGQNDESDAFRHFMWAAIMTKKLGQETTKKFLDAHENTPEQSNNEKVMDLYNNNQGIAAALKITKSLGFRSELEKEGLELIKNKKLKVIRSSH